MSNTTPNTLAFRLPGYVQNTTSATPPSLTDPALNTAFKNRVVAVGDDRYFVDATGAAVKLNTVAEPLLPNVRESATTTTFTADDDTVILTTMNTVTDLPTAVGVTGKTYTMKSAVPRQTWVRGAIDAPGSLLRGVPAYGSVTLQSDGTVWRVLDYYDGQIAPAQNAGTANIEPGVADYLLFNGSWRADTTLPVQAPYIGFELVIRNEATLTTTIGTANSNLTAPFALTSGKSKAFKWGGNQQRWMAIS